jgi:RNA polymerase sigma-70 factor (ECF subfamily)
MSRDDLDLYARYRDGDEEALQRLFDRHAGAMRARVLRLVPRTILRRVSVADVLQEARIVAYRKREEFQPQGPGSFRGWLLAIVELKTREAVRFHAGTAKRAAGRELSRGLRRSTNRFAAVEPSPSEVAMDAETRDRSRQALKALSGDDRRILRLAFDEQLTLREAAKRMGRSREAAKKLYGRALIRFRHAYEELEEQSGDGS